MNELSPGWVLREEESTPLHWVGACRDVAMVFAYDGSQEDVRHVLAGARVIEQVARDHGPAKLLVVPPHGARPPDARVRSAFVRVAQRLDERASRIAIVVAGEGFGAAVHRGAATGVLAIVRPRVPVKIHASVRDALAFLIDRESAAFAPLVRFCEERMRGPG